MILSGISNGLSLTAIQNVSALNIGYNDVAPDTAPAVDNMLSGLDRKVGYLPATYEA